MEIAVEHTAKKCSSCDASFSSSSNLRRHCTRFHQDSVNIIALKTYAYTCALCSRKFTHMRNLTYHKKQKHGLGSSDVSTASSTSQSKNQNQCPLCGHAGSKSDLIRHFKSDHEINITTSVLEFSSLEAFNTWKTEMEKNTKALFSKYKGIAKTSHHSVISYCCHRSGNYIARGKHLRHLKTQGSNKINGFCPASLKVVVQNNLCKVSFVETHVGHQNDLRHLVLTAEEREMIARKMSLKVPFTEILDEMRDSAEGSKLNRLNLLTKRDLYNIEKSFNLQPTVVRHRNDAVSVDGAWVAEMEQSGCVLFYKPQDVESEEYPELRKEDVMLIIMNPDQEEVLKKYCTDCICVDGTHGLNQNGFQLHTILVLDDVREAFPCAFLFSNRSDEYVLRIFFNSIRVRINFQVACKVFTSEMAESYYNAWMEIMGPAKFRLFCTWHVDQCWRRNLTKISSKEKQVEVYKYLHSMLKETDERAFRNILHKYLLFLASDPETLLFADYFKSNYVKNTQSWAYCFHKKCGLNSHMRIERMHRTIKNIYFNGRKVQRLDKTVHEIQKFARDRLFSRLIVPHKENVSSKLQELRSRHRSSECLGTDLIVTNDRGWKLPSTTSGCYEVYSIEENQIDCDCRLICTECHACIHKYACTCIDSSIKWNMCKHIHLLCRYLQENSVRGLDHCRKYNSDEAASLFIAEDVASVEVDNIVTTVGEKDRTNPSADVQREKAILISHLLPQLSEGIMDIVCMEQVTAFKKLCAPILPTLKIIADKHGEAAKQLTPASKISESHNKNIKPQRRLYTTKTKKTSRQLSKPSNAEV